MGLRSENAWNFHLPVGFPDVRPENIIDIDATVITATSKVGAQEVARRYRAKQLKELTGSTHSVFVFNPGHANPLLKVGLLDDSNAFKVEVKGTEPIYCAAVEVKDLMQLATDAHGLYGPIDPESHTTYWSVIANSTAMELNSRSLRTNSQARQRSLRPEIVARKLQDKRRTENSIRREVEKTYKAKETLLYRELESAKILLEELRGIERRLTPEDEPTRDSIRYLSDTISNLEKEIEQIAQFGVVQPLPTN